MISITDNLKKDFCVECRKETGYSLQIRDYSKFIKDKNYNFEITTAVCSECGSEMSIPGLIDRNIQEIDEQYRLIEDLVTIDDIKLLMKIYTIGKAPLSLALGFGEVTITRYLEGQLPSKEYSDVIKSALASPKYMKQMLIENKDKLTETAFKKAMLSVEKIEKQFDLSEKMRSSIAYIFERLEEVTPLALQKLLYYTQGVHFALKGEPIFEEDCRAWVHGPVYREVYDLFKDFKYNPIDDIRFAILEGAADTLTDEEKEIINLVINTFGMYGGKSLEKITHNEKPWIEARNGYGENIHSNAVLSKESIHEYFDFINREYGVDSEQGLKKYINKMLR